MLFNYAIYIINRSLRILNYAILKEIILYDIIENLLANSRFYTLYTLYR